MLILNLQNQYQRQRKEPEKRQKQVKDQKKNPKKQPKQTLRKVYLIKLSYHIMRGSPRYVHGVLL